jgi:hypothetical protein
VLRAIDIYTEKSDGSIKSVKMTIAGRTGEIEQTPEVIVHDDPVQQKSNDRGLRLMRRGSESSRYIVIHAPVPARQSHGMIDACFEERDPDPPDWRDCFTMGRM